MMRIEEFYKCDGCGYIRRELFKDASDLCGSSAYDGAAVSGMNAELERSALSTPCPKCGGRRFHRIPGDEVPAGWRTLRE